MYLAIDNSADQIIFFLSKDGNTWEENKYPSENEGDLERCFEQILQKKNIKQTDLTGIAVRVGEGRFTATRLAVTFANTLAFSLQIPVVTFEGGEVKDLRNKFEITPVGQFAPARYSAEPRLGGK